MGTDYIYPSQQTQRILIQNNLFDDINGSAWGGTGAFAQVADGGADIVIDHNTALHSGNTITATYNKSLLTATNFVFTNNIASYNQYGIFGDYGVGLGMLAINAYFPGSSFARNAIVGGSASAFPADNYYPSTLSAVGFIDMAGKNYALASGTPYVRAGTDGKDVGVDFTAMAPHETNWIAVAKPSDPADVYAAWTYTDGQASGSVTFHNLPAGTYVARAYEDWFNTHSFAITQQSAEFTVGVPTAQASHERPLDRPTNRLAWRNQRTRSCSGLSPVSSCAP